MVHELCLLYIPQSLLFLSFARVVLAAKEKCQNPSGNMAEQVFTDCNLQKFSAVYLYV